MDPDECYQISKQTLELMDQFAGSVSSRQKNLPSILHFPEPMNFQKIQPNVLKKAPSSMRSQLIVHHTELDDNPNMPHYSMEVQYMDFNHLEDNQENESRPSWNFDNLTKEVDTEDDDDEDWKILSLRANNLLKKQISNEPKNDDNYFVREDKDQLRQIRENYGFNFSPNVEYKLTKNNPLLSDDL